MSNWVNEFNFSCKQAKSVDDKDLGSVHKVEDNYVITRVN